MPRHRRRHPSPPYRPPDPARGRGRSRLSAAALGTGLRCHLRPVGGRVGAESLMPKQLEGKVVLAVGNGTPEHRAVVMAMAESGADIAVAGDPNQIAEVLLHSISNE